MCNSGSLLEITQQSKNEGVEKDLKILTKLKPLKPFF